MNPSDWLDADTPSIVEALTNPALSATDDSLSQLLTSNQSNTLPV